ncbi:MAG: 1-deoxy-D-xylulose-5-phosphate reductoisomerase, partial [Pseudomonadales bacterium]|nr:1-deoxy-D-xylulose-5-phosphate reductoisomerase [Pseudomonadales bacterium]
MESPANSTQRIAVLGSTGSIGKSTLSVLAQHRQSYEVFALSANSDAGALEQQCREFKPRYAVLGNAQASQDLQHRLRADGINTELLHGPEGLEFVAGHSDVDTVMAAIVGAAGLASTLRAARGGKKILLANKESLVVAGALLVREVQRSGARLLPIDSEHNAIFQCLQGSTDDLGVASLAERGVRKLLLTGSGGPFRTTALEKLPRVTPEQACAHPNWSMGRKISVDSATMMNKGLEFIEACWLFNCGAADIEILVHPQSVVHSMVEYIDGSVLAQLGVPDMRTPIAHALAWPQRISSSVASIDWRTLGALTFEAPDTERFPALSLSQEVAAAPGSAAAVVNAANEIAVAAFLERRLKFTDIVPIAADVLALMGAVEPESLSHIQAIDDEARRNA